jgi:quercetin dioxygenase-like cupin family protein
MKRQLITDADVMDNLLQVEFIEADNQIAKRHILPKGGKIGKHIHTYSHLSVLGYGSVRVETPEGSKVYDAGDCIVIKANTEHFVTALEDACWLCIHNTEGMV